MASHVIILRDNNGVQRVIEMRVDVDNLIPVTRLLT